jgi:hypothetical protein
MAALTQGRKTPSMVGVSFPMNYPQKGSTVVFAGSLVMVDSSGRALPGATATGCFGAGRAKTNGGLDRYDATGLGDGVNRVEVEEGIFKWANSTAGDLITVSEIGKVCYIVDDQTVAKTSGSNTRSKAGIVRQVDSDGVWVEMSAAIVLQATV